MTTWSPGEQTTVLKELEKALARSGPNFEFIDFSGEKYTLGFLDAQSTSLAHGLRAAGAKQGECVVSILDNCIEQLLLLFACAKIGAIHVPLNTAYKGEYLRHQASDASGAVLIAEKEYVDRLISVEAGLPEARVLFVKGEMPATTPAKLELRPLQDAYVPTEESTGFVPAPSDLVMLIYTAGTTGLSKGCMISHNYVCNMGRQLMNAQKHTAADVIWTPLPGFHFNQYTATIMPALMAGARCAVFPRFSVSKFWPEVERTGATVTQILSSMVRLIAEAVPNDAQQRCVGQLRIAAGAPFPPELQEVWRERFKPGHVRGPAGYGLTECAIVVSASLDDEGQPGKSSGHHNDDFEVIIVDDNDFEVPAGTAGEILVRPKRPHVMFEGYWRRPAETMKVLRNFWFHTGDIGMFDEDGFFFFLDRKKDYLRRRGENISSMEVEGVFSLHPQIKEVAVHAVLADMEDDVKATLILEEGATITEEELCRWSVENLPYFAVPRFIEFRSELPKNPVGRVLKYELREQGITDATWDREASQVELVKR